MSRFRKILLNSTHFFCIDENTENDEKKILFLSAAIGVLLFALIPISYFGDSTSYLSFAKTLSGQQGSGFNHRTPGYPLLMIFTGVIHFNSFIGLVLCQLLMAVVIPLIIYRIVSIYERKFGYYTAMISIISLIPYSYMKTLLTEQSFIFFLLVATYSAARFFTTKNSTYVYLTAGTTFIVGTIRPAGLYIVSIFFITFFVFCFSYNKKALVHTVISLVATLMLFTVSVVLENSLTTDRKNQKHVTNTANMTGKLLFFNAYLSQGLSKNNTHSIEKTFGPASKEFIALLSNYLSKDNKLFINFMETKKSGPVAEYNYFYKRFEENPGELLDEIIQSPARTYYWFLWQLMDEMIGPSNADSLFLKVSLEILKNRPRVLLKFVGRNMFYYIAGWSALYTYSKTPQKRFNAKKPTLFTLYSYTPDPAANGILSAQMQKELKFRPGGEKFSLFCKAFDSIIWQRASILFRPIVFFSMLLGGFIFRNTHYAFISFLSIGIVFYQVLIVSVFNEPLFRYVSHTLLIELLIAIPVLGILCNNGIYYLRRMNNV